MSFDAGAYGDVFAGLISEKRLNPLDGGDENTAAKSTLDALTVASAFAGKTVVDEDMARACISAMWLYHNFLDASHTISQNIHTATGSYWHGIMHRREPDFSNSKYWFGKVGNHAIFDDLCKAAAAHCGRCFRRARVFDDASTLGCVCLCRSVCRCTRRAFRTRRALPRDSIARVGVVI